MIAAVASFGAENPCAEKPISTARSWRWPMSRGDAKNISISFFQNMWLSSAIPPRQEGRFAIVTNVGRGAVAAMVSGASARRLALLRTAKPCGSDTPMLVSRADA